jgi:phospholipid/cholesterol/gamma-HCH transport system substrate-binding protein
MRMTRRIWIQLGVLLTIASIAFAFMIFGYMRLPDLLFGVGHYTVTVQLPEAAGLYERANVTYRGSEVGTVKAVQLVEGGGVEAILSLRSDVAIPADLDAQVHSTTAVGEQYVALLPRTADGPALRNGDVIDRDRATVPPDINSLLDATDRGLRAIPAENLQTVIDESYTALGGLGPDIARIVHGSTAIASTARTHLNDLTNVIDNAAPVLNTQAGTADSVQAWASHLATITTGIKDNDTALRGILRNGSGAADEARQLFDRLQPTLPLVLANLASIAPVLVTYRANLEQILVLVPMGTQIMQAVTVPNQNTKQAYQGAFLDFNLNLNLPPACTTGFLPAQQQRGPSFQDYPERPAGDLYCRVPQDAMFNVRGARNLPCETRPGKRAPTVKMCESDEPYVPLNDGYNWKGDPNATLSGQSVPQLPPALSPPLAAPLQPPSPAQPAAHAPVTVATYDPATGGYVGPDGRTYNANQGAGDAAKGRSWQSLLIPPGN